MIFSDRRQNTKELDLGVEGFAATALLLVDLC
jgi:hypothetical protein